jgi:hypothetical protein
MTFKLPPDMIEFLNDHPHAAGAVRNKIWEMMRNSATGGDDPKQAAKLCRVVSDYDHVTQCRGFDGEHAKWCKHYGTKGIVSTTAMDVRGSNP